VVMKIRELGHVVLYVSNLEKMADFYRETLGFTEIIREWPIAAFSGGRTHHELLLIDVGKPRRHAAHGRVPEPGLYHIGFKVGDSTEELKKVYKELKAAGVHVVGTSDHGVTHSLYILDPDGNELELYADVSDEWKHDPKAIVAPVRPLNLD